ncbi:MAG: 30S ribosomal protein S17 [Candidatus Lambdaproteobacteria bacterium]|nr:30S ribosomal protein S17 [Candidatus Lambdaproteobacteria bacterium]
MRKVREGVVVSNKMNKTAVVKVERTVRHPLYKKIIKRTKRFQVHDENNVSQVGDTVRIMECRPLSRHKRWRLVEVLKRGE